MAVEGESKLYAHLPPGLQPVYASIPEELRFFFEKGLDKIPRGQGATDLYPLNQAIKDLTVLDHTAGTLDLATEVIHRFPNIASVIYFDELGEQILVHDGGEIFTGDPPMVGRTKKDEQKKKNEHKLFMRWLIPGIPDQELRQRVTGSYLRYIHNDPEDVISQFAHLLDKAHGITREGAIMFGAYPDPEFGGFTKPPQFAVAHLEKSLPKLIIAAQGTRKLLPPKAQEELDMFVEEELTKLDHIGYSETVMKSKSEYDLVA